MYETSFSLSRRPFSAAPDAQDFVAVGCVEAARESALRCLQRSAGSVLVVGSAGTGKTLLCQVLQQEFASEVQVATLCSAQLCTRRALLQAILFELGLPYREREEGELRLSLIDHLTNSDSCPNGMLLLVDEAHTLPLRLLEEIRMITNLVRDGESRVRLLLAGTSSLEERLASPRLESLNQRVAARCYLEAMNRDETDYYVTAQIQRAGGDAETFFPADARGAVYNATAGIPRLVNQVCDHSLIMAVAGGHERVTAAIVEESWADLQQLPTPWTETASALNGEAVHEIEFGSLADDDSEVASADAAAPPSIDFDLLQPVSEESLDSQKLEEPTDFEAMVDPVEQINQLESAIADAEDEPVDVASASEVQLVFHGSHDPFGEAFDHEEDVVDQYSDSGVGPWLSLPQVSSSEGQAIDKILATAQSQPPVDEVPSEPLQAADGSQHEVAAIEVASGSQSVEVICELEHESAAVSEQLQLSKDVAEFLGESVEEAVEAEQEQVVVSFDAGATTDVELGVPEENEVDSAAEASVSVSSTADEILVEADDDRDVIIIDHTRRVGESESESETKPPAKRPYSQLFARLRQA